MTWILLTFIATTGLYLSLVILAFYWLAKHLQGHPEAMKAIMEHVLIPLIGKKRDDAEKKKPAQRDARLV